MVFASPTFLFIFMPVALALYWIAPARARNALLLAVSLVFYAWGEPVYVFLMLFSIGANYLLARAIERRRRRALLVAALILNLGMLAVFKYADFAISTLNAALGLNLPGAGLSLPVGISFYTFQILSYVIDVWRGGVPAQRSVVKFGAYVTMFPQLIAGPIVRYSDVAAQLERRSLHLEDMAASARRFCVGLAKKVVIANLAAELADLAFDMPAASMHWTAAWLGAGAYAIQIYFDFSGYSDMAIGLGAMLGFRFNENFNYPYISRSVREFWRRWHISLSGWFRDYLYIPLGGSRRGAARTYRNLLIVFALCGLWHGASWNFVLWGLYHGLFLVLERQRPVRRALDRLPGALGWVYTMAVVAVGWVLFRADTLPAACSYIGAMFGGSGATTAIELMSRRALPGMALGALGSLPLLPLLKRTRLAKSAPGEAVASLLCVALLVVCMAMLAGGTYNPFIYFRF